MKRILLTTILASWAMMVMGQVPSLHQLYWSEGSITLESKQTLDGLTSYYPSMDVIFFKEKNDHHIKTYHISQIASLNFFDNGMRLDRKFVKLRKPNKQKKELFEIIPVNDFIVLRVPDATNYQYDPRSRQFIDKQDSYTSYRYWIALEHPTKGLAMMPRSQANKIIAYIRTDDLDCYNQEDQLRIQKFYQKKIGDQFANNLGENLVSISAD